MHVANCINQLLITVLNQVHDILIWTTYCSCIEVPKSKTWKSDKLGNRNTNDEKTICEHKRATRRRTSRPVAQYLKMSNRIGIVRNTENVNTIPMMTKGMSINNWRNSSAAIYNAKAKEHTKVSKYGKGTAPMISHTWPANCGQTQMYMSTVTVYILVPHGCKSVKKLYFLRRRVGAGTTSLFCFW